MLSSRAEIQYPVTSPKIETNKPSPEAYTFLYGEVWEGIRIYLWQVDSVGISWDPEQLKKKIFCSIPDQHML